MSSQRIRNLAGLVLASMLPLATNAQTPTSPAGQYPPSAAPQATTPQPPPAAQPPTAGQPPTAAPPSSPVVNPASPPSPTDPNAPLSTLPALQNAMPSAMAPEPTPAPPDPQQQTTPAFGAGAVRVIEKMDGAPTPRPAPAKFVPSEVETIAPHQVKIGDPRATLHTSLGDITIRLFSGYAPQMVKNFMGLAKGEKDFFDIKTGRAVKRPFYINLLFHRVLSTYLIQAGCPFGNGRGGPGYTIPDEFSPVLSFDKPGMVAMAAQRKDGVPVKDTNGSQFFITLTEMPEWNGKFSIFGEVEHGMAVVKKIGASKTGPTDRPLKRVYLYNVDIKD